MSFYNRNPDNQQLFIWAAVAFAAYWFFFRNKLEFYESQDQDATPTPDRYQRQSQPQESQGGVIQNYAESFLKNVSAPPPEEIPQYANAFTL